MTEAKIMRIERAEVAFAPQPWPFAEQHRAEIDAHFQAEQRKNPALWNGQVLLMHRHSLADGVLRGACLATDYASFLAWRDWGYPDKTVVDVFASSALLAADGAFVLGVMGPQSANARRIYFPCGTPDPHDVVGSRVDFTASARRELKEETGLDAGEFEPEPGWYVVCLGSLMALIEVMRTGQDAERLRARILSHIAGESRPELSGVRLAHGPADLDPLMPGYVLVFLRHVWGLKDPETGLPAPADFRYNTPDR